MTDMTHRLDMTDMTNMTHRLDTTSMLARYSMLAWFWPTLPATEQHDGWSVVCWHEKKTV
jgi:hypothetical protein